MHQTELPYHEAAILTRIAGPDEPALSAAAAKGILTLVSAPPTRTACTRSPPRRARGTLTSDEQAEVEAYSRIGSLLGILKSKARRALKRRTSNGKAKTH